MTDHTDHRDITSTDTEKKESFWWRLYDFPFSKEHSGSRLQDTFGSASILPGGIIGGMIANEYASTPLLTEVFNNSGMALGAVVGFKAGHVAAFAVKTALNQINKRKTLS